MHPDNDADTAQTTAPAETGETRVELDGEMVTRRTRALAIG
jgi:hypothetical protein